MGLSFHIAWSVHLCFTISQWIPSSVLLHWSCFTFFSKCMDEFSFPQISCFTDISIMHEPYDCVSQPHQCILLGFHFLLPVHIIFKLPTFLFSIPQLFQCFTNISMMHDIFGLCFHNFNMVSLQVLSSPSMFRFIYQNIILLYPNNHGET
jgi:hypothetical protein